MPIRRKQGARSTSRPRAPPRSWCSPRQGLRRLCCGDRATAAASPLLASGSAFARLRPNPRDLLRQHLHGLADLLLGVRGRAEEAQARRGLLDRWIEDRLHVDAALLEPVAYLQGVQRVAEDGGDHCAASREAGVDALLLGQPQEQPRPLVEPRNLLRVGLQLAQGLERRRGVRRRNAHAVDEPTRAVLEELDQLLAAADVAAAGGEALAQRAHPEVDVGTVDAEVLADARPGLPHHADGVRLVDQQEAAVLLLQLDEPEQL